MQNKAKNKWRIDPVDLLIGIIPSLFVVAIATYYFIQLKMQLNMLLFFISPIFITYFVVRSIRTNTSKRWIDWLSIFQYSILFLIGFYSVINYMQKQNVKPIINASIILSLTAFMLLLMICITLYCTLDTYKRIILSKRLYEKQIDAAYQIYRDCYQLFQEVKNFISFSYKLTSLPPQETAAQQKLKKRYAQLLSVQKNILAKKQAEIEVCKFYLPKHLQQKLEQIFQLLHQLYSECPTEPEEIQQYEKVINAVQKEFENSLHRELGFEFLFNETQAIIRANKDRTDH